MLHTKAVVVDDEWSMIGSANLDVRSMKLNFELNVLSHCGPTNKALASILSGDFKRSERIDPLTVSPGAQSGEDSRRAPCGCLHPFSEAMSDAPDLPSRCRVAVIGGGAAGFFAAIACAEAGGGPVLLLEKSSMLLAKVRFPAAAAAT